MLDWPEQIHTSPTSTFFTVAVPAGTVANCGPRVVYVPIAPGGNVTAAAAGGSQVTNSLDTVYQSFPTGASPATKPIGGRTLIKSKSKKNLSECRLSASNGRIPFLESCASTRVPRTSD